MAFKECPHMFVYSTTLYVSIAYKKLRVLYCINKHQQAKQKQKKKNTPKKVVVFGIGTFECYLFNLEKSCSATIIFGSTLFVTSSLTP